MENKDFVCVVEQLKTVGYLQCTEDNSLIRTNLSAIRTPHYIVQRTLLFEGYSQIYMRPHSSWLCRHFDPLIIAFFLVYAVVFGIESPDYTVTEADVEQQICVVIQEGILTETVIINMQSEEIPGGATGNNAILTVQCAVLDLYITATVVA